MYVLIKDPMYVLYILHLPLFCLLCYHVLKVMVMDRVWMLGIGLGLSVYTQRIVIGDVWD